MKRALWIAALGVLGCVPMMHAQNPPVVQSDTLGMHNMSVTSGSSVTAPGSLGCIFCHAPHSGLGGVTPLWNQALSGQAYSGRVEERHLFCNRMGKCPARLACGMLGHGPQIFGRDL